MAFKLVRKGWEAFSRMLDARRFRKTLKVEIRKATKASGELLRQEYRDAISGAKIGPRNKPLTVAIKKRDHPLLDTGAMRDAIEVQVVSWKEARVGIPKGTPAHRVATIVSEGARIEITDKMRVMFTVLWHVSEGRMPVSRLRGRAAELWARSPDEWFPLSPRRRIIRIPKRPFIAKTFKNKTVIKRVQKPIEQAVVETWRKHVKAGRGGK